MKFRTRSSYPSDFALSPAGTIEEIEYKLCVGDDGLTFLKEVGKRPIAKIISESCKGLSVKSIMERFLSGDSSVIGDCSTGFADVTGLPKTLAEAKQQLIDAENLFNGLNVEIRRHYDHNVSNFLSAVQDGSFVKTFGVKSGIVPVKKEETNVRQMNQLIRSTSELNDSIKSFLKGRDSNA